MRENSGKGESTNNNLDPTLKEHEAEGGHRPPSATPGEEAVIGANARRRGEDPSPGDRERGETSVADAAAEADTDKGR